ncbi:MAG: YfhO family protein [Candidatus Tantalella remota]|nr:YfhO family protein [Candidatus Tantalella remota]
MKKKTKHIIAVGFFVVVILSIFADLIFRPNPKVIMPEGSELFSIFIPFRTFAAAQISKGIFPLWSPYVFCGMPFFSSIETAVLYPFNFIFSVMPVPLAVNWTIVLHLLMGGIFMYLWAASRRFSPSGAMLSAFIFILGAPVFMFVYTSSLSNLCTVMWAPLVFLVIDKLFDDFDPWWVILGMAAVAMQAFAGHAQYLFYTGVTSVIYFLLSIVLRRPPLGRCMKTAGGYICVYLGAVLLAAVQLTPALLYVTENVRSQSVTYEFASLFSFPPENFLTMLAPGVFGDTLNFPYWGRWFVWEVTLFTGVSALLLAASGALWSEKSKRRLLLTMVIICAVFAMGSHTMLFKFLYNFVPGFNLFRGNCKFIFLMAMFLAMLGGAGFDWVIGAKEPAWTDRMKKTSVSALVAAFVVLGAALLVRNPFTDHNTSLWQSFMSGHFSRSSPSSFGLYRSQLSFVKDAGIYAWKTLLMASVVLFVTGGVFFLASRRRRLRFLIGILTFAELVIFSMAYRVPRDVPEKWLPSEVTLFLEENLGDSRLFWPGTELENFGMITKFRFLWGHTVPLLRYSRFMFFTQGHPPERSGGFLTFDRYDRLYEMLRCKYLVLKAGFEVKDFPLVLDTGGLKIYETKDPLPVILLVDKFKVIKERDDIFTEMADPGFDPRKEVILEEPPDPAPEPGGSVGEIEVTTSSANYMIIRASLTKAAVLVVTDSYSSGWRAIDIAGMQKKQYHIMPANYVVRAIPLAAGEHLIRIEYLPPGFIVGLAISSASGLFLLLTCVYLLFLKKVKKK